MQDLSFVLVVIVNITVILAVTLKSLAADSTTFQRILP